MGAREKNGKKYIKLRYNDTLVTVWVDLLTFLLFDFYCYFFFNKLRLPGTCREGKNFMVSFMRPAWEVNGIFFPAFGAAQIFSPKTFLAVEIHKIICLNSKQQLLQLFYWKLNSSGVKEPQPALLLFHSAGVFIDSAREYCWIRNSNHFPYSLSFAFWL